MTEQDKYLLLKDLCARLPYGVICKWENLYDGKTYTGGGVLCDIDHVKIDSGYKYWDCYFEDEGDDIPIELVKPYLRPMSSMAEKERMKIASMANFGNLTKSIQVIEACTPIIDYCYSRHLDIHCLIEKGLALPAPEGLYVEWLQS